MTDRPQELSDEQLRKMVRENVHNERSAFKAQQHRELEAQMNVMRPHLPSHTRNLDDARAQLVTLKEKLAEAKKKPIVDHVTDAVHRANLQAITNISADIRWCERDIEDMERAEKQRAAMNPPAA